MCMEGSGDDSDNTSFSLISKNLSAEFDLLAKQNNHLNVYLRLKPEHSEEEQVVFVV